MLFHRHCSTEFPGKRKPSGLDCVEVQLKFRIIDSVTRQYYHCLLWSEAPIILTIELNILKMFYHKILI